MNTPMSPAHNPVPAAMITRQKVRPFSFVWGVIFLAVGSMGFASGSFGLGPGPVLSFTFVLASCVVLYLVLNNRRLTLAAQHGAAATSSAAAPSPTSPEEELYLQALAELDNVDYTVASPEQILADDRIDPDELVDPDEATGSTGVS